MNEAVTAALDSYIETTHPVPHAILVEGPWGSGKSTFLRSYFEARTTAGKDTGRLEGPLFISLFGLKSASDLQRRIRESVSPLGSDVAELVGGSVEAFASAFGAKRLAQSMEDIGLREAERLLRERVFVSMMSSAAKRIWVRCLAS